MVARSMGGAVMRPIMWAVFGACLARVEKGMCLFGLIGQIQLDTAPQVACNAVV